MARERYACFEHFGEDPQAYGYAAGLRLSASCEDEVVMQLVALRRPVIQDGVAIGGAEQLIVVGNAKVMQRDDGWTARCERKPLCHGGNRHPSC